MSEALRYIHNLRLGDYARKAWRSKRLWWAAFVYPFAVFWVVVPGHLDSGDPLSFAFEFWTVLKRVSLDQPAEFATGVLVVAGALCLQARVAIGMIDVVRAESDSASERVGILRRGRGLWRSAAALLLARQALAWVVLSLLLLPAATVTRTLGLEIDEPAMLVAAPLVLPFYVLALGYVFALDACCQLGLQSVVANRRGATSAFQHGWRLLAHDPSRSTRIVATWAMLQLAWCLYFFSGVALMVGDAEAGDFLGLLALPFAGAFSAYFWADAYRLLGGIRTV